MKRKETHGFQSEVKQLLHMMIHSLYSNKEIFLRELISNASDAADKLRFRALSQPEIYEDDCDLCIRLSYDKEKRTIALVDNGIGMTRKEVIDNLGTIAKSGTKAFIKSMGSSEIKDTRFIGQFGVGFYSVFMVADKVTVCTRSADSDASEGVFWESSGKGDYTVADIIKPKRGTEITLYLRKGEEEFLDYWRIKQIVSKYSDHITLPVEIKSSTKSGTKDSSETNVFWEQINKAQALWTRNKSDISNEEYKEFYKHLSHDINDPLTWSHNRVEGKQEYTSLLYIPSKGFWDTWNRDNKSGLKLYVQRVFIMDDVQQLMPKYLRFVKGLVDSNDLPLNVSREVLQDNRITKNLKGALTKRVLSMLEQLAKNNSEQYELFWKTFGLILKEAPGEDPSNNETIAKLLRFSSTYTESAVQTVSLESYINRMVKGQDTIYYVIADSYSAATSSPHLELLRKKGIEVLLLSDRIDAWMMGQLTEFNGKSFQSVSVSDSSLDKMIDEEDQDKKQNEKTLKPFVKRIKDYLGERVKDVRLTYRLIDTPSIVTTESSGITTHMAKLFSAAGQTAPEIKYVFEINPNHLLIKRVSNIEEDSLFSEWIELFLDQALLAECGILEDPNRFIRRINQLLINST